MFLQRMQPTFFATPQAFRKWLWKNHTKAKELLVGYYKVDSGKPSMTWSESVDQALCFGWIDGVRKSLDETSYTIRFTPRKPTSNWSAVNIKKMAALTKAGLVEPAGQRAFEQRTQKRSGAYSYENEETKFPPAFEKLFKANKTAWKFFHSLAPSYRKTSKKWVMSAKQEITRLKRLNQLIRESANGTNQWKDNKYTKKR